MQGTQTSKVDTSEYDNTKKRLDQQIEAYQKLLKEYDVKLNESAQFQQMKKLLHDKNKLITELKNKFAEIEK
jgi:phenylalanyl-tRNA synthetase alpha subunit